MPLFTRESSDDEWTEVPSVRLPSGDLVVMAPRPRPVPLEVPADVLTQAAGRPIVNTAGVYYVMKMWYRPGLPALRSDGELMVADEGKEARRRKKAEAARLAKEKLAREKAERVAEARNIYDPDGDMDEEELIEIAKAMGGDLGAYFENQPKET